MSSLNISKISCCCQCSLRDINAPPSFSSTPPLQGSPGALHKPLLASHLQPAMAHSRSVPAPSRGPATTSSSPFPRRLIPTSCHPGQAQPSRRGGTLALQTFTPIIGAEPVPMPYLSFTSCHCHPCDVQSGSHGLHGFCLLGLVC